MAVVWVSSTRAMPVPKTPGSLAVLLAGIAYNQINEVYPSTSTCL